MTDIERVDLQTRTYSFTKQDKEAFLKFTFNVGLASDSL